MMAGRVLQKRASQEPQAVMTFELLTGTNGRKMSKTQPHCVFVEDEPADMYGKIMSLSDELIVHYLRLATDVEEAVIKQIEFDMSEGANPRDSKAFLARSIVARYHGIKDAELAEQRWNEQFREGNLPDDIDVVHLAKGNNSLVEVVSEHFELSKSEVRRLLEQRGVKINGEVVEGEDYEPKDDDIIQVGKRRFKQVKLKR
jgi:tyrosyl-tRNA synthetase